MRKNKSSESASRVRLSYLRVAVFMVLAIGAPVAAQTNTFPNSGNVGVGTNSPQTTLDVRGSSAYGVSGIFSAIYAKGTADYPVALILDGAGTNDNFARLRALNNGQTKWQMNFSDDVVFWSWSDNFYPRFAINGNGNVGVGTTSPAFDGNTTKYLSVDGGSGTFGSVGVGGNVTSTSYPVGQMAFFNSNLSTTEKRLATIVGQTNGATNTGAISFWTASGGSFTAPTMTITPGNVGIGTTTPANRIEIKGGSGTSDATTDGLAVSTSNTTYTTKGHLGSNYDDLFLSQNASYNGSAWVADNTSRAVSAIILNAGNADSVIAFLTSATNNNGLGVERMRIDKSGNVGIGTTTPGSAYKLDVNGAINATGLNINGSAVVGSQWTTSGSNINYATSGGNVGIGVSGAPTAKLDVNGDIHVSGNINAKYQDVAEWVPSSEQFSAGTVVVLDSTKSNQVTSSTTSYDTRVAGVISEQPGIALGEKSDGKVLVATTGRVRVKVNASKGAVNIGDLLVTSDIPGVAMKSEPVNLGGVQIHRPGTLIGKALEPLQEGSGTILVLLSLQ